MTAYHSEGSVEPDLKGRASSFWRRFVLLFTAFYLALSAVVVYAVLDPIPFIGEPIGDWMSSGFQIPALWLVAHVFHAQGITATAHPSNSRDTVVDWVISLLLIVTSLLASGLVIVFHRNKRNYERSVPWLRLLLRMVLIFAMLRYGFMKIFALQMPPPSLAVLNEPLGNTSPLTLLWTLIGLHPAYERLCGGIELACAVLLLFRRTALMGTLFSIMVMVNVLIYNLFFDVPVKLGAAYILLYAIVLLAPELKSLVSYFWRHLPTQARDQWVPHLVSRRSRIALCLGEAAFVSLVIYQFVPGMFSASRQQQLHLRESSSLVGEWNLDSCFLLEGGKEISMPVLTGEGLPLSAIYLEPNGAASVRSTDGRLWRAQVAINKGKDTFRLSSGYFDGVRFNEEYRMSQTDKSHLILTPAGDNKGRYGTLALSRVSLLNSYPLLQRGFHWTSEWGYER